MIGKWLMTGITAVGAVTVVLSMAGALGIGHFEYRYGPSNSFQCTEIKQ